jgi:hypothetical protein
MVFIKISGFKDKSYPAPEKSRFFTLPFQAVAPLRARYL